MPPPPSAAAAVEWAAVDTLVLAGGGVRGLAYAGALEELSAVYDWWSERRALRRVCGCSVGALYAAMICAGATAGEIGAIARGQPLRALVDPDIKLLFSRFGSDTGDALLQFVDGLLRAKTSRANLTFAELYALTGVELELVATNLNLARAEYLSRATAPDMRVAEGVTVSMALPPLFCGRAWLAPVGRASAVSPADCGVARLAVGQRVRLGAGVEVRAIDGAELPAGRAGVVEAVDERAGTATVRVERSCTLVDGGLLDNYPFRHAAVGGARRCVGMRLSWRNAFTLGSITSYFSRALCVALTAAEQAEMQTLGEAARDATVTIDTGPVDTVDLDLPPATVEALLARGRLAMLDFIQRAATPTTTPTSSA